MEQISDTQATVYFSMNPPATGQTDYGVTNALGTVHGPETSYLSQHIQTLRNLQEGTTYFFKVSGTTQEGAFAESSVLSFTTTTVSGVPDPQEGDTTPPQTQILSPSSGTTVAEAQPIDVVTDADDNVEVEKVDVFVNDALQVTFVGNGPYSFEWQVDTPAGAQNRIRAQAQDTSGNVSSSEVVVETVQVTDPAPAPQVLEITDVRVEQISDTQATVYFSMNPPATGQTDYGVTNVLGTVHGPETSYLSQHIQTLRNLQDGTTYFFKVSGTTQEGAFAESSVMSFTTTSSVPAPDLTPPTVDIVQPGTSVFSNSTVPIVVETNDNEGVDRVDLRINGTLVSSFSGSGTHRYDWRLRGGFGETDEISVVATDLSGNEASDLLRVTRIRNKQTNLRQSDQTGAR